jgi:hypothetical protein
MKEGIQRSLHVRHQALHHCKTTIGQPAPNPTSTNFGRLLWLCYHRSTRTESPPNSSSRTVRPQQSVGTIGSVPNYDDLQKFDVVISHDIPGKLEQRRLPTQAAAQHANSARGNEASTDGRAGKREVDPNITGNIYRIGLICPSSHPSTQVGV